MHQARGQLINHVTRLRLCHNLGHRCPLNSNSHQVDMPPVPARVKRKASELTRIESKEINSVCRRSLKETGHLGKLLKQKQNRSNRSRNQDTSLNTEIGRKGPLRRACPAITAEKRRESAIGRQNLRSASAFQSTGLETVV